MSQATYELTLGLPITAVVTETPTGEWSVVATWRGTTFAEFFLPAAMTDDNARRAEIESVIIGVIDSALEAAS